MNYRKSNVLIQVSQISKNSKATPCKNFGCDFYHVKEKYFSQLLLCFFDRHLK
jgi:hypothetical protein